MLRIMAGVLALSIAATVAQARDLHVVPKAQVADAEAADGSVNAPFGTVWSALRSDRIAGGDRIVLGDGAHGVIKAVNASFDPPVRIVSQNPDGAHADKIIVRGGRGLHFQGLSVWPRKTGGKPGTLIRTDKHAIDMRFDNMDIRGRPDAPDTYMSWSKDEWLAVQASGAYLRGPENRVTSSRVTGVMFGITTTGDGALVADNRIEGFGGDGLRGLGDGSIFTGNRVKDCVKVNSNHDDGFQSWATKPDADGRKTVSDIVIENNSIVEWTGRPDHPLRCRLQGIGLFDGIYRNFTIRNNLVAVNSYHGISLYGGADSRIVNNTVVHISGGLAKYPWIMVANHKNGWKHRRVMVRNNVAMSYKGVKGALRHNGSARYPARLFQEPARLDFRPKPDGPLIDAGTSNEAPDKDITGAPRKGRPDLGAFEVH